MSHSEQVTGLCLQFFDELRKLHGLGAIERELIEYAALLHDIGWHIAGKGHHKHSMNLIANGDKLTGKVGETFRNSLEQVRLSRTLATIHCEAPVDLDIDGLVRRDSDREALAAIKLVPAGLSVSEGIRHALRSLSKA